MSSFLSNSKIPAQQYNDLLKALDNSSQSKSDVYKDLMNLESNVLSTVNRVAESKLNEELREYLVTEQPISAVIALTANNWINMMTELVAIENPGDIFKILLEGNRKIYFGLLLACIGLFIFFIEISS